MILWGTPDDFFHQDTFFPETLKRLQLVWSESQHHIRMPCQGILENFLSVFGIFVDYKAKSRKYRVKQVATVAFMFFQ